MSFFWNNNVGDYRVIVDITSSKVTMTVIQAHDESLTALWSYDEPIRNTLQNDIVEKEKNLLTSIMQALMELQNNGLRTLEAHGGRLSQLTTIECIFSSEWTTSAILSVSHTPDALFEVTPDLIDTLQEEAVREHFSNFSITKTAIHNECIETSVNGYIVKNPKHKNISELTFKVLIVSINKNLLDKVTELLQKIAPRSQIIHTSRNVILSSLLPATHKNNATIIDLEERIIEVITLEHQTIQRLKTIKIGTQTFIDQLAIELNLPAGHLASILNNDDLYQQTFAQQPAVQEQMTKTTHAFKAEFLVKSNRIKHLVMSGDIFVYHPKKLSDFWLRFLNELLTEPNGKTHIITEMSQLMHTGETSVRVATQAFPQQSSQIVT